MDTHTSEKKLCVKPIGVGEVIKQIIDAKRRTIRAEKDQATEARKILVERELHRLRKSPRVRALAKQYTVSRNRMKSAERQLSAMGLSAADYISDAGAVTVNWAYREQERRLQQDPAVATQRLAQVDRLQGVAMRAVLGMTTTAAKRYLKGLQQQLDRI